MKKSKERKIKFAFYIMLGIMGWGLLLIDTTPGNDYLTHLKFFRENLDAVEGIIFIFISAFEMGKLIK